MAEKFMVYTDDLGAQHGVYIADDTAFNFCNSIDNTQFPTGVMYADFDTFHTANPSLQLAPDTLQPRTLSIALPPFGSVDVIVPGPITQDAINNLEYGDGATLTPDVTRYQGEAINDPQAS